MPRSASRALRLASIPALVLGVALRAPAQAPGVPAQKAPVAAGGPAPQAGPRALLESAAGDPRSLPLASLDTADPRQLGAQLVRFEGLTRPDAARKGEVATLELAGEGRLYAVLRGGRDEALELELLGGAPLELPIEELASLAYPLRVPEDGAMPLEPARSGDRLYLYRSGGLDRVDGAVQAFSDEGVRFESASLGTKLVPWGEVSALFVESLGDGPAAPREGSTPVAVDLVDGSRVRGSLVRLNGEQCQLALPGGRELALPVAAISEVVVEDGAIAFLSSLAPSIAEPATPFGDELGMSWPHRVDRSVSGGPLRAGGRIWTRGLGVHAPNRLGWKLAGAWKELRGLVAIDDEVLSLSARGSARFRILADGELRWQSPILRGGDPPLAFPSVSLEGVDELVLETDAATELFVADRADWLQLVLRK